MRSEGDNRDGKNNSLFARYQTWSALLTVHGILLAVAVAAIAFTSGSHQEAARAAALFASMGLCFALGCVGLTRVFLLAQVEATTAGTPVAYGLARWRKGWIGFLEVASMWLVAFAISGVLIAVLGL